MNRKWDNNLTERIIKPRDKMINMKKIIIKIDILYYFLKWYVLNQESYVLFSYRVLVP